MMEYEFVLFTLASDWGGELNTHVLECCCLLSPVKSKYENKREGESAKNGIMHDTITTVLGTFEMGKRLEFESKRMM